MNVKEFLEQHVEGYLFADLDSMEKIPLAPIGNCGNPIVMSVLAGIELLGTLTFPHRIGFERSNVAECGEGKGKTELGKPQFDWYWKHFLAEINSCYKKNGINHVVRSLLRNGLAHLFVAKPGIEVRKFDPGGHMKSSQSGRLIIDSRQFASDFKQSYWKYVRPIVDGEPAQKKRHEISIQTMQERFDDLSLGYTQEAEEAFSGLNGKIPPVQTTIGADPTGSVNVTDDNSFTVRNIASKSL